VPDQLVPVQPDRPGTPSQELAELAKSEALFRMAMEHAPIGMMVCGIDGRWLRANRRLCAILGRVEDELIGITFTDLTHPDDLPESVAMIGRVLAGEFDTFTLDKRYAHADGSWVRVRLTLAFTRDGNGKLTYAVGQVEDLTEERRVARQLEASERRIRMLADGSADMFSVRMRTVPEIRMEHISDKVVSLTGHSAEEFLADPTLLPSIVHPEDLGRMFGALADPESIGDAGVEVRIVRPDGGMLWVRSRAVAITDDDGAVVGSEALVWDVTAQRDAEEAAEASRRRFQALVEHASDAVAIHDEDGVVRYLSPAITEMLGYTPEDFVGAPADRLLGPDAGGALQAALDEAAATPNGRSQAEIRMAHRDGREKWLALMITNRLDDPDVGGLVVNIRDATDERAAREEIAYQASHDALTGLPNRTTLQRYLVESLAADPEGVGVLFVDLSGLKPVNDTLGHARGDAALVAVALRIQSAVGDAGRLGRFGGDEFAVVTRGLGPEQLTALAETLVAELDRPVTAPEGGHVYLTASTGIALSDGRTSAEHLLANADLAMYAVKRRTGRGVQLFDATLADQATERLGVERDLRDADLETDLRAHYQPIVRLDTGRISGAEALLRWNHPGRGLVPPGLFIPVAEETGLIDKLGLWVLRDACRAQVAWSAHEMKVAVNLSPRQLYDPHLAQRVADILAATGARADHLVLEVTESALIDDRVAAPALAALKELGAALALDDFGTGYSSLTSLRRYPFDTIKIDRSFVAEIGRSTQDMAIVQHVIHLAHDLGMRVVAEGVETAQQLDMLAEAGADVAQGYFLGRPAPAADMTAMLGTALRQFVA
jgi:diguanylate cyclase (GGDEF)-like protein/PAS domain S-box-containing protein